MDRMKIQVYYFWTKLDDFVDMPFLIEECVCSYNEAFDKCLEYRDMYMKQVYITVNTPQLYVRSIKDSMFLYEFVDEG